MNQDQYGDLETGEKPSQYTNQSGHIKGEEEELTKPLADAFKDMTILFKAHLILGLGTCFFSFIAWHYLDVKQQTAFHWWLYPIFCFALTLTAHAYFGAKAYWVGFVSCLVILNILLMVINGLTSIPLAGQVTFVDGWFYYCWGSSAMLYFGVRAKVFGDPNFLTLAFYQYLLLNFMLFLAWFQLAGDNDEDFFPWFLIPIFVLAVPLVIWYLRSVYKEYRIWVYGGVSLGLVNIMMFMIWGFVDSSWPWFLIPWGISAAVIAGLWKFLSNAIGYENVASSTVPVHSDSSFAYTGASQGGFQQPASFGPSTGLASYDTI